MVAFVAEVPRGLFVERQDASKFCVVESGCDLRVARVPPLFGARRNGAEEKGGQFGRDDSVCCLDARRVDRTGIFTSRTRLGMNVIFRGRRRDRIALK